LPRHCQTKGGSFPSIVCLGNTQRSVSVSLPEGHAKLAQAFRTCCPNLGARPFQAAARFKHTVSLEFRHIRSVDGCTFPSSLRLGNTPSNLGYAVAWDMKVPEGRLIIAQGFHAGLGPSNRISPEGTTDHLPARRSHSGLMARSTLFVGFVLTLLLSI